MMSLCSAHLEEKHQWGAGIGVEDDLFLTNEEWTSYKDGAPYTGIPGHAIELATMRMYAVGVFTLGGFEKIVEVNCGHPDYVATIPPRCFFFTTLLTSPGGTRPQPSQRLGLYASLGPNAPFFFVFSSPKNKKNTLDAH